MNLSRFNNVEKNLEILAEECAEVIQAKSKLIRFGIYHKHHVTNEPGLKLLEQEIGDVLAMVDILVDNGIIDKDGLTEAKNKKLKKLDIWYDVKL